MVVIDQEFKMLLPMLTGEERRLLEESIIREGCRDPIVLWRETGILIDGHNRYDICTRLQIPYREVSLSFKNRSDVIDWIYRNQMSRRNITDAQRTYIIGKLYREKKRERGAPEGNNNAKKQMPPAGAIDSKPTREIIADEYGIGKKTVERAEKFADAVDTLKDNIGEDFSRQILEEKIALPKVDVQRLAEKPVEVQATIAAVIQENPKEIKRLADAEEKAAAKEIVSTFNRTNDNIEWAKWSWNPVTGCKHNCQYCYARDIANRFYSEKFEPTFRPERLDAPKHTLVPANADTDPGLKSVFVCSMADLFGDWVPQEWIDAVLQSVRESPEWTFIFLTKNPKRLVGIVFPQNAWVGTTVDVQARVTPAETAFRDVKAPVRFLSCEPMMQELTFSDLSMFEWLIIGGRSQSSGMPAGQPEWVWIEKLLLQARKHGVKVYFKPNLTVRPREYPEVSP